jgi:hypothetical protein
MTTNALAKDQYSMYGGQDPYQLGHYPGKPSWKMSEERRDPNKPLTGPWSINYPTTGKAPFSALGQQAQWERKRREMFGSDPRAEYEKALRNAGLQPGSHGWNYGLMMRGYDPIALSLEDQPVAAPTAPTPAQAAIDPRNTPGYVTYPEFGQTGNALSAQNTRPNVVGNYLASRTAPTWRDSNAY